MATAVSGRAETRLDRYFFPGMALLMLATVLWGFARTYYLAANWLVHVHGAVFSCWILLLVTQTSLVAANRVDVHRKLGLLGFGLAPLMVVVGTLAATDQLRRRFGITGRLGMDPIVVPLTDMLVFGTLVFFAFRARFNPPAHKRLMLIATTALSVAAVIRWPIGFIRHSPIWVSELCTYGFLLLLLAYDLWSTGKVHRATIWASTLLIVVQRVRMPLGETGAWHAFATWAQNLPRAVHG
jgi:hypothetical protein